MRRAAIVLVLWMAVACSSENSSNVADDRSLAGIFFNAMFDEMRGPPSTEALEKRVEFAQGGVRFQRPEPLRVRVDRDPYSSWSLERGDFELELHAPDGGITAADYLGLLAETLGAGDEDAEGPLDGRAVNWCGQDVTGVLYRFNFLGDPHVFEGFDLPPTREGPRFLVFNDIRKKEDWSETAKATFAAIDASIECDGGKIPVRDSTE
ncbi:MAG TPA: hypothetical protein VN581_04300 [Patescibacteria group bacterium]|nr:hypothetical protein [Patescibacteria group bacterium]